MKRRRRVWRWLGRRGGLVALAFTGAAYWASGHRAISIEPTRHEHIGFACGMCQVAWRTTIHADPGVFGDPGVYTRPVSVGGAAWMSQFSSGDLKDHRYVFFPMWVFIAAAGVWAGAGLLWPRPLAPGLCRRCRYDRAGLVEGMPCPECGSVGGSRGGRAGAMRGHCWRSVTLRCRLTGAGSGCGPWMA